MAGAPGYYSCDLFAIVAFLCPDVVEEKNLVRVLVELDGTLTRGQCVVDWDQRITGRAPNVNLVLKLNGIKSNVLLACILL